MTVRLKSQFKLNPNCGNTLSFSFPDDTQFICFFIVVLYCRYFGGNLFLIFPPNFIVSNYFVSILIVLCPAWLCAFTALTGHLSKLTISLS